MTSQWRHLSTRMQALVAGLHPTPTERQAAFAAAGEVVAVMGRALRGPGFGPGNGSGNGGGHRVVGGFDKGTALAGASTVDVLVVLPDRLRPRSGRTGPGGVIVAGVPPMLDLITAAATVLAPRFGDVGLSRGGWLTVTLDAQDTSRSAAVRVLPGFACATGGYLAALPWARNGGSLWRLMDPDAERRAVLDANTASRGKAVDLILMLKLWRRHLDVPIPSFAIELLVIEFLRVWLYRRQSAFFYDWMVRDFFFWLVAQADRHLMIPGSHEAVGLGRAWVAAAEHAYVTASQGADFERENEDDRASACWRRIFGHDGDSRPLLDRASDAEITGGSPPRPPGADATTASDTMPAGALPVTV